MYHLTSCDNFNYVVVIRTIHHETFEVSNLVVLREPQVVRVETSIMSPPLLQEEKRKKRRPSRFEKSRVLRGRSRRRSRSREHISLFGVRQSLLT